MLRVCSRQRSGPLRWLLCCRTCPCDGAGIRVMTGVEPLDCPDSAIVGVDRADALVAGSVVSVAPRGERRI